MGVGVGISTSTGVLSVSRRNEANEGIFQRIDASQGNLREQANEESKKAKRMNE